MQAPPPPGWRWRRSRPRQATAGVALDPQPVVQLKTGDGADLTTAGIAVSVAIQGGGSLSGTTTGDDRRCRARRFTDLVITGDPGTRTLLFTASGFTRRDLVVDRRQAAPPSAAQSSIVASPTTIPPEARAPSRSPCGTRAATCSAGRTVTPRPRAATTR